MTNETYKIQEYFFKKNFYKCIVLFKCKVNVSLFNPPSFWSETVTVRHKLS